VGGIKTGAAGCTRRQSSGVCIVAFLNRPIAQARDTALPAPPRCCCWDSMAWRPLLCPLPPCLPAADACALREAYNDASYFKDEVGGWVGGCWVEWCDWVGGWLGMGGDGWWHCVAVLVPPNPQPCYHSPILPRRLAPDVSCPPCLPRCLLQAVRAFKLGVLSLEERAQVGLAALNEQACSCPALLGPECAPFLLLPQYPAGPVRSIHPPPALPCRPATSPPPP
jgi:hypothetical protein